MDPQHQQLDALYESAMAASEQGEHRNALATFSEAASAWLQLKTKGTSQQRQLLAKYNPAKLRQDQTRLHENVYGVPKSDGRVSLWRQYLPSSKKQIYPPEVVFYAWARHSHDTIYRVGGFVMPFGEFPYPVSDLVWAFNCDTKSWRRVETKGSKTPGLRAEHGAFVHQDGLYVLGGSNHLDRQIDMKLHRLDLKKWEWDVVKVKGAPPPGRSCFALCQYQQKVFIHGGVSADSHAYFSDLWCLDMSKSKPEWRMLSSGNGSTPRKSHCIFTDGTGQLVHVFGGLFCPPGKEESKFRKTIKGFEAFNAQTKIWQKLACVGDDPWDLAEMCAIPLYEGQPEPQSVLIWGGYREGDEKNRHISDFDEAIDYKDKHKEYGLPYRRRLLNYNFASKSWRVLVPARRDLAPTAQSIATEIGTSSDGNTTSVLIVGGYGLNSSSSTKEEDENMTEVRERMVNMGFEDPLSDKDSYKPKIKQDALEVQMQNGRVPCFADRVSSRTGWEWNFWKAAKSELPRIHVSMVLGSPTFHWIPYVAEDDFRTPPSRSVEDNAESLMLGQRVILHGLKARQNLNGKTGRCGRWLPDCKRYVVVVRDQHGSASVLTVKSTNIAFPDRALDVTNVARDTLASSLMAPTRIMGAWNTQVFDVDHCHLDPSPDIDDGKMNLCADTYTGPLASKAMAVLDYVAHAPPGTAKTYSLVTLSGRRSETQRQEEQKKKVDYYQSYVRDLREVDGRRVEEWTKALTDSSDESSWCRRMHIKVSLDGIQPTTERELLVSPKMSLAEFHHQVLTPSLGWQNNMHAYAFRSKELMRLPPLDTDPNVEEQQRLVLESLKNECWIGPSKSTALDLFFLPLYIGGALADDREVMLGDIFYAKNKEVCYLQYVYDFGAWWSHTIEIRRYTGNIPDDAPPASLLHGNMACPPDDVQGIQELAGKAKQLAGVGQGALNPSQAEWWELLHNDWRSKLNYVNGFGDPIKFEIEHHRTRLEEALLVPLPKRGKEGRNLLTHSTDNGLSGSVAGPGGDKPQVKNIPTDPKKFCAVCKVTAALSLCSGCRSVAFCSREHQLQFWPQHKAACKATQRANSSG